VAGVSSVRLVDPEPVLLRFLTLAQVAEELNVSRSQVYALVRDRSLVAVKIGGRGQWRVERRYLEEYIAGLYREAESRDPADVPGESGGGGGRRGLPGAAGGDGE